MTLLNKQILNKSTGNTGEAAARLFLTKKGYKVIDTNFRIRNGEIDIIALDSSKKILVFVEVKTRRSTQFGTPFEAITHWKLEAMTRGAEFYKITHPRLPDAMRFDAISVLFDEQGKPLIEHMENISGF